MENPNSGAGRGRRQLVLLGAALSILLIVPVAGSAAQIDDGHFFIQAHDIDEPQFEAKAGVSGKIDPGNPGGGPGDPGEGGGNPASLTGTVTCGTESTTVTQAMLDWSATNEGLAAAGQSPKVWPGSNWYYIYAGSYYEASSGGNPGVTFDQDLLYIFSNTPTTGADYLSLAADGKGQLWDAKDKTLVADIDYDKFRDADGTTASIIGSYDLNYSGIHMSLCSYYKFENGKLSSATDAPAYFAEINSPYNSGGQVLYASHGIPLYGTDKPSYTNTSKTNQDGKQEFFYKPSNGERWDYEKTKGTLWHVDHFVETVNGVGTTTVYTDCFGETNGECTSRLPNPTIEKRIDSTPKKSYVGQQGIDNRLADAEYTEVTYKAPELIDGAGIITVKSRSQNDTILKRDYFSNIENDENALNRLDGPVRYSEDETGAPYNAFYSINGKKYTDRASYEAAGGTGWIGAYEYGKRVG